MPKAIIRLIAVILIASGVSVIYQVYEGVSNGLLHRITYLSLGHLTTSIIIFVIFVPCSLYGGIKLFCIKESGRKTAIIALITGSIYYFLDISFFNTSTFLGEIYFKLCFVVNIVGILVLEQKCIITACNGKPFLFRFSLINFWSESLSYAEKLAVIVSILSLGVSFVTLYYSYFKKSYEFKVNISSCFFSDSKLNISVNLINSGNTYVSVNDLNIAFSEHGNGIISFYKNAFKKSIITLSRSSSTLKEGIILSPGEIKNEVIYISENLSKENANDLSKRPFLGVVIDVADSTGRKHSIFYSIGEIHLLHDGSITGVTGPLQLFSKTIEDQTRYTTWGDIVFQVY